MLKKKYNNLSDLLEYAEKNNLKVERDYNLDTYGTGGRGYYERRGLRVDGVRYQVIFSSAGYGTTTQEINFYNHRFLDKHSVYCDMVNKWWAKNFII